MKPKLVRDKNGCLYGTFAAETHFLTFDTSGVQHVVIVPGSTLCRLKVKDCIPIQNMHKQLYHLPWFTIMKYAQKIKNPVRFVETGTEKGDMVEEVQSIFKEIYSIEIDKEFYNGAKERFKDYPNIHIIHGNSGDLIPQEADLYWLDAHCIPKRQCPLMDELKRIEKFEYILMDDADYMLEKNGLPTLHEIFEFVKKKWSIACQIENDVIIVDKKYKYYK